ncbi:MAG TPA: BlaI/MecI/CopY family transcriptional regulator [Chloroflexota bacterium]|nr:BlaI/MecI/CopY family transcriptional regulator [Chloroflexota bacterium]
MTAEGLGGEKPIGAALAKGLGPLEMEVLDVIWEMGQATSREVFEKMRERKRLGQSTVLTVLRRLSDRGILRRDSGGEVYVYSPAMAREELGGRMIDDVIDRIFGGAASPVLTHLFGRSDVKDLSGEQLSTLRAQLNPQ